MNYNKIGEFIATERKAKKLTQAKLAEKVFVSEKTISKWENGKSLPDTDSLPKLCKILDVSLNELLNGEKNLTKNEYNKNELILLKMANELNQKNKIIWISMWVIMIISTVSLIAGVLIANFLMPEGILQIVTVLGICIAFLIPCFYALKLEVSVGAYKCKNCGFEIEPTYTEVLWAMHRGTTRHLKCPNCQKRTWCKKILNKK
jgi:transcriptional regulator with XRE-family HTH domain/predicted RNA-binding Zn-ribbon protein involved in translation (DUF1610 family)